ncbi:MAG: ribosome small subunit-dependent GTPase A [Planctomycetota bacterium]
MSTASTGIVLRIDARVCYVQVDGVEHVLPLRGRIIEDADPGVPPLAVGDRVRVQLEKSGGGVVEERLPRETKLARTRGAEGREHVIAANVSLALVVSAAATPAFQPGLVDRILAGVEEAGIVGVLAITKVDLDTRGARHEWVELYRGLGYEVFETSVHGEQPSEAALERLQALLRQNVTVLSGASGVGKSSLINALCPGLSLRVGDITKMRLGRHTTTRTELLALDGGGYVLDTPGVRGFGLFAEAQAVQFAFREIAPLVGECGYRNCQHLQEPDCAVLAAVERGDIHESRYRSYREIIGELLARG